MNVVDLHPEELLDKDARGELSEDERARLETHLARCVACRAERALRLDFAAELAGDERPSSPSLVHGLVQGVLAAEPRLVDHGHPEALLEKDAKELSAEERLRLDAHLAGCVVCRAELVLRADFACELAGEARRSSGSTAALVEHALLATRQMPRGGDMRDTRDVEEAPLAPIVELDASPSARAGTRRRTRRTAMVMLFAAALLAAGAASATGVTSRVWLRLSTALDTTHTELAPSAVQPSRSGAIASTTTAGPRTTAPEALPTSPAEPESPVVAAVPVVATAMPVAPAPVALARVAFAPPSTLPVANTNTPPPPVAVAPAPIPTSASELFDAANTARRLGDTATALARYEALERQFPQSREARLVKATTARLLLDRGDATGALTRFDAYLAGGSPELREEAMAGRATALERLGRDTDEVRAWAALLATYPQTPYAAHARARVGRSLPQ